MIKRILEWLYPSVCVFCGKICKEGICTECRKKVRAIGEPRCKKCGKPIRQEEKEFCYDCEREELCYEQGRSLWLHKMPVSSSIYAFKYKNRRVYGEVYGKEMAKTFGKLIRLWEIDVIVPVPLHKKKRKKRGYNQAEILAEEIGLHIGIPVDTALVRRKINTVPQKEFTRKERKKNLENAFETTGKLCGKRVLIVDDIYTTGSTIHSISVLLKNAGAEKTYFLTISIGQGL